MQHWVKNRNFRTWQVLGVKKPNAAASAARAKELQPSPWRLMGSNCLNETHDVLAAYGCGDLPAPRLAGLLGAVTWYEAARGMPDKISDGSTKSYA